MTATSTVFESLPGLAVPVGQALERLSDMWSESDGKGSTASDYRASRMNLIVHIGFEAATDEANALFKTVISFSHRYPCRLIVLCPQPDSWDSQAHMSCKIFSECVIDARSGGMGCCEVLILGYTLQDRKFLENQVSIFLETDLPTYYWPTRFGSAQLLSDYKFFFKRASRIIFDSSRELFLKDQIDIPQPEKLHDLAFSRLLSIRQCLGQFLSGYEPKDIVEGLREVTLSSANSFRCEGRALLAWIGGALQACYDSPDEARQALRMDQQVAATEDAMPRLNFIYDSDRYLAFDIDLEKGEGRIEADLGGGAQSMITGVRLLELEAALAEALFFA